MRSVSFGSVLLDLGLLFVALSCVRTDVGLTSSSMVGTYQLSSIDSRTLPAETAPGKEIVDSGMVLLRADASELTTWHGTRCAIGACITYSDSVNGSWQLLTGNRIRRSFSGSANADTLYVDDGGATLYSVYYIDSIRRVNARYLRLR